MKIDLTAIYKKYKGKWIVMDRNLRTVVASGTDAQKAYERAVKRGEKKPTLFKVPKKNLPQLGFSTK